MATPEMMICSFYATPVEGDWRKYQMAGTMGERSFRSWRTARQFMSAEVIHYDTLRYLIGLLHFEIKRGRRKFLLLGDEATLGRIWIGGTLGNRYTRIIHSLTCSDLRHLNTLCDEVRFKGVPPNPTPLSKCGTTGRKSMRRCGGRRKGRLRLGPSSMKNMMRLSGRGTRMPCGRNSTNLK